MRQPLLKLLPAHVQTSTRLLEALTHRSAGSRHNERLEYLGDSVLNFIIAEHLYRHLPQASEGDLSRLRASLVNKDALALIARDYGLGEVIHLGQGELKSGGFRRDSILADTLEAIIGAVYLETDFASAQQFVIRLYANRLANLPSAESLKDPKTRLQEYLQEKGFPVPQYELQDITGKPHEQHFRALCLIHSHDLKAIGEGSSRRKAEQAAAAQILEKLQAQTQVYSN